MKDLKLSLIIEALDRATTPLRKIGGGLKWLEERTEKLHHAMHKLGLAEFIGGAFFTGAAVEFGHVIFEMTDRVAEMGETALRAAEKTGASVEAMQQWSWAAKQVGVDADNLNRAFAMMEVHVGSAIKGNKESIGALKLVGIGMREVRELSKDPGAMFGRIIEGFQNLKNPTAQAVAAQALFSRSWIEMAPLLKAPREEVAELMSQLEKAHVVMTKEDAEASLKFIQAKQNMGLAVSGLGVRIGRTLLPRITQVIEKITEWLESLKDEAIKRFTDAVGQLADKLPALLPHLENLVMKAVDLVDKLLELTNNTKVFKGVLATLTTFLAAQAIVAVVSTTTSMIGFGGSILAAAGRLLMMIPLIEALTIAMSGLDGAMLANPLGVIMIVIAAILAAIGGLIYGLYQLFKHWRDVVSGIEDGCRKIEKAFTGLESKMPKWLQAALNSGGAILSFQFPVLGVLGAGIDTLAHTPAANGQPAAGSGPNAAPGGRLGPASYRGPARAPQMLGTITIKAEPGTRVQRLEASGAVDFQHRGRLEA